MYRQRALDPLLRKIGVHILCILFILIELTTEEKTHSSLVLFQGPVKQELDGKDCPVGVAFNQPETFSCACINGVWAFYNKHHNAPIAIIGGNNHCFPLPFEPISLAVIVSNPLRALGESLTVFENDMESIRSKIYRNIHMALNDADQFLSFNSSWTLSSPDGSRSICLESKSVFSDAENDTMDGLTYCSFIDVRKEMPLIGAVKKGCNSSMILEPIQCQPILQVADENICMSSKILDKYKENLHNKLNPNVSADKESDNDNLINNIRLTRAMSNLGEFSSRLTTTQAPTTTTTTTSTEKYGSIYKNEPLWHKKWAKSKDPEYFSNHIQKRQSGSGTTNQTTANNSTLPATAKPNPAKSNNSTSPAKPNPATPNNLTVPAKPNQGTPNNSTFPEKPNPEYPLEDGEHSLDDAWKDPMLFLTPPPSESNQLVTNHLWMYERTAIRNVLQINRIVPPEENMSVQMVPGKIKELMKVHAEIMKAICPIVPESYFAILSATFVELLAKAYRYREPYVEHTNYLRILTALTLCLDSAEKMKFKPSIPCTEKGSDYVILPDVQENRTVTVKIEIPEVFKSEMYEPVVESAWKMFVSVHSYCFKDFEDQFQDHHKYTTLMMGLFTNQLHDIWFRNKAIGLEYAGVLGNIQEIMQELDRCVTGARMTSIYPFHMKRPQKLVKYRDNSLIRKKRSVPETNTLEGNTILENHDDPDTLLKPTPDVLDNRFKRENLASEVSSSTISVPIHINDHKIFNGKGVCLRKYSDTRM